MSTVTTRFSPPKRRPSGDRRRQEGLGDLGRHVAPEGRADEVALAEALQHLVERAGELADLVARAHRERPGQVPAGDAGHPGGQGADGPRELPGEEQAQAERGDRADPGGVEDRRDEIP
jgi:hypothetical protein